MTIPELCIKRPVFTVVLSLILIIFGVLGFNELSVRSLPEINKPVISIKTGYSGASADLIEKSITTPLENSVATVNGINTISSDSQSGESVIRIEFNLDTDIDAAFSDVRSQVAAAAHNLPKEASASIIKKANPDAKPILILSFSDKEMSPLALADYVQRNVVDTLQQVNGVSLVNVWGAGNYAMRIWLDPILMAKKKITASDVITALQAQNVNIPVGEIENKDRVYAMTASSQLSTAEEFSKIIIGGTSTQPIYLKDVAKVEVASDNPNHDFRVKGQDSIGVAIVPDTTANSITVAQEVIKKLAQIRPNFPQSLKDSVVFDRSIFISESINDVYHSLGLAIVLVLLVVYGFLGSVRSACIPIVTIPVCLIATFALMHVLGYSINTITLLALVLSIGLVVDDAIVVLENTYRHVEDGLDPHSAAIKGSREIIFAIIAMTITLAAVYAPTAFIHGVTGQIFQPFAFTLAGAVIISGFVALTLTPMMCSRFLKAKEARVGYAAKVDHFFERLLDLYRRCLHRVLAVRPWVIVAVMVLAVLGYGLFKYLPSELAPLEDEGVIFGIVQAPTNASFDYTNRYTKDLEAIYKTIPEVQTYLSNVGDPDNQAFSALILKPWSERSRSQAQISRELSGKMKSVSAVRAFPITPAPLGMKTSGQHAIQIMLMTTGTYRDLTAIEEGVQKKLEDYKGLTDLDHELKFDSNQYDLTINHNLASAMNVSMPEISQTMSVLLGGNSQMSFDYAGDSYAVMVKMPNIKDPQGINQLYVRSNENQMLPLSSIVSMHAKSVPLDLSHFNRLRTDTITAELAKGYNVGEVINYLNKNLPAMLPQNAQFEYGGAIREYLESSGRMALAFSLALIFIYLVLSAQFESFVDPLIILVGVPLCIIGALLALALSGNSLNIYSNIGLITLVGLIAKHGILITEFANQEQEKGKTKIEAIVTAASMRLRPILMTTAAMVLGAIPLAFASGAGAAARHQVGWVIVGGMLLGTFFSLFVVPVAYSYLGRKGN